MSASKKQLGFFELIEIGQMVEKQLVLCDNKERNKLVIKVPSDIFRKIDEDMYYRQNPDGKDFKPSEHTILINFNFLTIEINKKESD